MFARGAVNHRLKAREQFAEGAALVAEGSGTAAADRLLRAAAHALAELGRARGVAPAENRNVLELLTGEGALSFAAASRLHELSEWTGRRDDVPEAALAEAVDAVQALVDLAAGLPAGSGSYDADAAPAERMPVRTTPWLDAARTARRRRLARHAAVLLSALLILAGAAMASMNGGTPPTAENTELGIFAGGS
ncbi:MAG: hypothetical protein QOF29_3140 [bacterium]|jgi:hypothetical protein